MKILKLVGCFICDKINAYSQYKEKITSINPYIPVSESYPCQVIGKTVLMENNKQVVKETMDDMYLCEGHYKEYVKEH